MKQYGPFGDLFYSLEYENDILRKLWKLNKINLNDRKLEVRDAKPIILQKNFVHYFKNFKFLLCRKCIPLTHFSTKLCATNYKHN